MNYLKPFYDPKEMPNGQEYETTFHSDFDIADHFGISAIQDTYNRVFSEWKIDINYIAELCVVMNVRSWFWYNSYDKYKDINKDLSNKFLDMSKLYASLFYRIKEYVYDDKQHYTKEEMKYFFDMTD